MLALSLFSSSRGPKTGNRSSEKMPSPTDDVSTSIISDGATIEGVLNFRAVNVRIEGTVHGDISTDERVVVAEGGDVQGTINARTVRLAGTVRGHVLATEKLVLAPTSTVRATLEADILEVQPGADFHGKVPKPTAFVSEEELSESLDATGLMPGPDPPPNEDDE
jgi:cytoskeletal protein CcmA (bactofilin family)